VGTFTTPRGSVAAASIIGGCAIYLAVREMARRTTLLLNKFQDNTAHVSPRNTERSQAALCQFVYICEGRPGPLLLPSNAG